MQYSDFEKKLQPCRNKNILLGFSGGADSCALFLLLEYWRRIVPFEFTAVHFEHGLRGEMSLADAEFCEKTAAKYGVDFLKFSLNVPENMEKNETVESAARRLRLEKWREITRDLHDFEIHLAHHSNDLAENVLLRLFRGANSSGLSGLREFSTLHGMPIRRILLDFSRRDIEDFLQAENFRKYCVDESNFDCTIGRNYLRNKLLSDLSNVFPYALKGIVQSAKVCEDDADFIESCADAEYQKIADRNCVENSFWRDLHAALRVRVLRQYFSSKLGYDFIPDKNFLLRFADALHSEKNSPDYKLELDETYFYVCKDDFWQLEKRFVEVETELKWDWRSESEIVFGDYKYHAQIVDTIAYGENCFYFDIDELSCPLLLGSRREGEQFEKFGGGHTSVKAELTNHKIRTAARSRVGILRHLNGEILLVGDFRRSSFAVIDGKKRKILEIRVEKFEK